MGADLTIARRQWMFAGGNTGCVWEGSQRSALRGWPGRMMRSLVASAERAASHLAGFVYSAGGRGSLLCVDSPKSVWRVRAERLDAGGETLRTSSAQHAPAGVRERLPGQEASV